MRLLGTTTIGDQIIEVDANTKRVARYIAKDDGYLAKLSLYCDGLGSGVGDGFLDGVIYAVQSNELLSQGERVVVLDGQAPSWVDLWFTLSRGTVLILAGLKYDIGYIAGGADKTIRVYGRSSPGV